jgi:hypothetical protein
MEMTDRVRSPWNWQHALHQVTGEMARSGGKLTAELLASWSEAVNDVARSIDANRGAERIRSNLFEKLERWSKEMDRERWHGEEYDCDMVELCDLLAAAAKELRTK